MHGQSQADPGRYATEVKVMMEMGWSWDELCKAPADLVDEILLRLTYQNEWFQKKQELQRAQAGKAT
ncbi:hypothetical protein GC175_17040 [bacterium]|nr:hypothetical protein [bacterium]